MAYLWWEECGGGRKASCHLPSKRFASNIQTWPRLRVATKIFWLRWFGRRYRNQGMFFCTICSMHFYLLCHFQPAPLCLRYIAHSSNTYCDDPQRLPFPTRLRHPREFIGCPCEASEFPTLYQAPANFSLLFGDKDECPLECRPPGHPEWIYC